MASRTLRHTPHDLVVFKVMLSATDSMWTVREIADATGFTYGTCYTLLDKHVKRRLVWRSYVDNGVGSAKLHFELNDYGTKVAERILKLMPDPEAFLDVCVVEDETTKPRLAVVGAAS